MTPDVPKSVYVPTPVTPVAPSPTGTPVVKPSLVPALIIIMVAINGGLLALTQAPGVSPQVKTIVTIVVGLVGSVLAVLSPGARKGDGAATVSK